MVRERCRACRAVAVDARSGALRCEDRDSGLVRLMIHGKSMLLDTKQRQRLADACST